MSSVSILVDIRGADGTYKMVVDTGQAGLGTADSPYEFASTDVTAGAIERIDTGRCNLEHLRYVGSELFDSVFSGANVKHFESLRQAATGDDISLLRLSLPSDLQQLPWEALYNVPDGGFVGTHPNYCIARELPGDKNPDPPNLPVSQLPLTVLVVIPKGSGLNIEQEWHNLDQVCNDHPDIIKAERFDGLITPELLKERLGQKTYNIVHFIGHGEVSGPDTFTIRLNDPDSGEDLWMEADTFANMFYRRPPQLVVLNCCLGAAASPKRTLTGIAPALLQTGVSAVVAMRYEIPDGIAAQFTTSFYRELVGGLKPGRIDSAVSAARQLLYLNSKESTVRGFVTPVLYLRRAREHLFGIPQSLPTVVVVTRTRTDDEEISGDLALCMDKLRQRDCTIVVGPGVLSSSALTRSAKHPPSIRELAERLAGQSNYPWSSEFGSKKDTEEWLTGLLLPWVCQHYQWEGRRGALIRSIEEAYQGVDTPRFFKSLTRLNVPGIIYTHFDGLIERAFRELNTSVQTIAMDQKFDSSIAGTVLMCPRGMLGLKKTLVLTEEDHEQLYENLEKLSPVLLDYMRGQVERSALFVGVSPRDEVVRRIARQILEAGNNRTQGPTFFLCNYHSTGDESYWRKYDVRWIACDIDRFTDLLEPLGGAETLHARPNG